MPKQRKQFLGDLPHTFNGDLIACVGTNGNPTMRDYALGFLNAAELLLEQQRVKRPHRPKYPADHMVYPICFNIRHGIEISVKYFIEKLEKLYACRQLSFEMASSNSHDIDAIWRDYYQLAVQFDSRLDVMARKLNEYIKPWAEIDPTGQTFRYAFSNDTQKHLTEYSTIDLIKVSLNLDSLKAHLEDNFDLLEDLDIEFGSKTFSKKLSRWELSLLAKELPPRTQWGQQLAEVKQRWQQEKGLSAREFSKACDLIQTHWEFATDIGIEVPLLGGITSDDLAWAVKQYMYYQSVIVGMESSTTDDEFFNAFIENYDRESNWLSEQSGKAILARMSPELVATISSLYYNNLESSYCEDYRDHFEIDLKSLSADNPKRLMDEFVHVLEKQTFISSLFDGLILLNQHSIIESLKAIDGIHDHFDDSALGGKQSRSERHHSWYSSLPKMTKAEKFLSRQRLA